MSENIKVFMFLAFIFLCGAFAGYIVTDTMRLKETHDAEYAVFKAELAAWQECNLS